MGKIATGALEMVRRITVTLADDVGAALDDWAAEQVRSTASKAAELITQAVRDRQQAEQTKSK